MKASAKNRRMIVIRAPFCLSAWLSLVLSGYCSSQTAIDIVLPDPHWNMPGNARTHGWAFTTNDSISVTHLGWFDGRGRGVTGQLGVIGDGFSSPHPVAIWTAQGDLVVSSTIESTDALDDQFRYREIPPTMLEKAKTYVIAGLTLSGGNAGDAMAGSSPAVPLDFRVASGIMFEGNRISITNELTFPSNPNDDHPFGPNFKFEPATIGPLQGDFNGDDLLTVTDLDLLTFAIRDGSSDPSFDVNDDGTLNGFDRVFWITDIKRTIFGDANLDREFNSSDLLQVFQAGEYSDGIPGNSTWSEGDFGGDGEFDSDDLVLALQTGAYEKGPVAAARSVPEPNSCLLILIGALLIPFRGDSDSTRERM